MAKGGVRVPKTDNQWFVVPDAVLERDDLTAHEKLMLVNLCRLIREDGCVRAGLDEQVAQWLAPSIVGLLVAIIGWIMLSKAKNAIAHDGLAPRQTIDSMRDNKEWAQSKLHPSS